VGERVDMGLEMAPVEEERSPEQPELQIYPLCRYYFGARDARPCAGETAADRALRLKANFAARGLRTCVHGVLLVELSGHPHVLLLQVRNSSFLLPGGRLRPAEQDVQGLKRKLSSKLAAADRNGDHHWQSLHGLDDRGVHWHVVEIRIRGQAVSISASEHSCTQGMRKAVLG
uniref:Pre-mRNA cleavage factor Im 25 kDa subunit n=1 Tax=Aegilops tauschii subsp. strangulata TaxID=200361 RepID=A0A453S4X9_AEGTS